MSCRSETTQDIREHEQLPSHSRRKMKPTEDGLPQATTLRRMSSNSSFHTAAFGELSSSFYPTGRGGGEEDAEDLAEAGDRPVLDRRAELAARECFGADADCALEGGPPRKSMLVSENSAIDGERMSYLCAHVFGRLYAILFTQK